MGRFCCPTCLFKLTFEKSLPPQIRFPKKANLKNRGPAVIAAGVGNPPAPACVQGCHGRVQDHRQHLAYIWPLDWPTRIRRTSASPASSVGLFEPRRPMMPTFAYFFRPRCRPLPIFSPFFSHLFFNAFLDRFFIGFRPQLGANLASKIDQNP